MPKISKGEAGYQYRPETEYTCEYCVMEKDVRAGDRCIWFGPSVPISEEAGSCIYFAHGLHDNRPDIPFLGLFTKEELDYTENSKGFGCKRCISFILSGDCQRVDKNSEGDTPGEINAFACCDLWKPDRERAGMSTPALIQMFGDLKKTK